MSTIHEKYIKLRWQIKRTIIKGKIRLIYPSKKLACSIRLLIGLFIGFSPLISIIISLCVAFFAYWLSVPTDFVISADPIGDEVNANYFFHSYSNLTVKDTPTVPFLFLNNIASKHYPYSVVLEANYFYNGTPLPKNFEVRFTPQGNTSLPFNSNVIFTCSGLPVGDHVIKISAHGGDGKDRSCPFLLKSRHYYL
jgi:hypothetical protein